MRPPTLFALALALLALLSLGGAAPAAAQPALLHIEPVPPMETGGSEERSWESDRSLLERDRERLLERYRAELCEKCSARIEPEPERSTEESMGGAANVGMWLGSVDLSGWERLGWGGQVAAIDASRVGPFGTHLLGGLRLGGRLEHEGFIRAPEYQLTVIGAELDGPWTSTGVGSLETRALHATSVGFSIAAGAQLPLGPFRLYALLRLGLRLGILDIAIGDAELGSLGTETLFTGAVQAGGELGIEWIVDGVGFQLAATIDPASGAYGGTFGILLAGED